MRTKIPLKIFRHISRPHNARLAAYGGHMLVSLILSTAFRQPLHYISEVADGHYIEFIIFRYHHQLLQKAASSSSLHFSLKRANARPAWPQPRRVITLLLYSFWYFRRYFYYILMSIRQTFTTAAHVTYTLHWYGFTIIYLMMIYIFRQPRRIAAAQNATHILLFPLKRCFMVLSFIFTDFSPNTSSAFSLFRFNSDAQPLYILQEVLRIVAHFYSLFWRWLSDF